MRVLFDIAKLQIIQILIFGSVFLGIYYFTLYDDGSRLRQLILDVQSNIDTTETKVKKKEKELEDIKEFEREILAEEQVIKYFLNFIPESLTYTDLSSLLIKSAEFTGVNIEVKKDQKVKKQKDSEYQTLQIQLAIDGSFSQIMLFLSKLTAQRRILVLKEIDMNIDQASRLIKANLNILAYRYQKIEKKEEENGNKIVGK